MIRFKTLIDVACVACVAFGVSLLTGCPDDKSAEEGTGPASGDTGGGQSTGEPVATEPVAPERPETMPMLCSVDGGKWCSPCPNGDAGPLCCSGETCVPQDAGSVCEGVVAWCDSYVVTDKIVTCVN